MMMNERIRELLKKVNAISYNDDNEEQEPVLVGRQQVEKFAELIVRECQFAIVSRVDLPSHERKLYNNVLKQHFGVES